VEFTHPLHGFDASNFSSSASSARPWGFDPHMAGAAAARSARNPAAPVTGLLHEPLPKLPLHRVELSQLHRFLNDPQGTFLRTRFDVAIPREQELPPDQLPAELDGLDKWKIGNDLLNAELAGTAEGFDERAVLRGAVPPADLGRTVLNEKRGEVDLLTDELTRLGINYGTTSRHAVAVETGSSLISGAVDVHESGAGAGPVRVLFSARKPKHLLDIWLDLLVLTVAIPERTWVATLLNKAKAKPAGPQRTLDRLVVRGEPGEAAEIARQAISRVLELYELGMSEPLPLFPATSHAALAGPDHNDVLKAWEGNMFMPGERTKPAGQLAVGSVDLSDLFKAPPRPTDPAGPGESRVERYAHLLWDAYEDSVTNHDGDDA
jgi:exodeoxyribonuclease V gamma subunit